MFVFVAGSGGGRGSVGLRLVGWVDGCWWRGDVGRVGKDFGVWVVGWGRVGEFDIEVKFL